MTPDLVTTTDYSVPGGPEPRVLQVHFTGESRPLMAITVLEPLQGGFGAEERDKLAEVIRRAYPDARVVSTSDLVAVSGVPARFTSSVIEAVAQMYGDGQLGFGGAQFSSFLEGHTAYRRLVPLPLVRHVHGDRVAWELSLPWAITGEGSAPTLDDLRQAKEPAGRTWFSLSGSMTSLTVSLVPRRAVRGLHAPDVMAGVEAAISAYNRRIAKAGWLAVPYTEALH